MSTGLTIFLCIMGVIVWADISIHLYNKVNNKRLELKVRLLELKERALKKEGE